MNTIEKLIFDRLAAGEGINLPDVGSLYVERDPARFISGGEIRPPQNMILFSRKPGEGYDSVVDLIMAAEGVERTEATKKYKEWLKRSKEEKDLIEIAGIGVLKSDFFYPSALLHDTLNPAGESSITLKKRAGMGKVILISVLSALGMAALTLLVLLALDGRLCCGGAGDRSDRSGGACDIAASGAASTEAEGSKRAEDVIQQNLEQYARSTSAVEAASAPIVYYVVAGVFANEANADKLIAEDQLMIGKSAYSKMPYKGMTMVTIFSSKSQVAAYNRHLELLYITPDLWVYDGR